MSPRPFVQDQARLWPYLARWTPLAVFVGAVVGSACALFLWLLDLCTRTRFAYPALLFALPVGGIAVAWLYERLGKDASRGNNLIVDEIHEPGAGGVPLRMAPLVLIGTLLTHLFGGSAGREGTAVQMGGSLASGLARLLRIREPAEIRLLLMTGVAAGFGGVFGTPVAGAVFALEVLVIGRFSHGALFPCLVGGIVADQVCTAWGIAHTHYHIASVLPPDSPKHLAPLSAHWFGATLVAGAIFGIVSRLFSEVTHGCVHVFRQWTPQPLLRPVVGGLVVIALTLLLGTRDYLGLGVSAPDADAVTIQSAFHAGGAHAWSWFWKVLFTAITLGSGFKGGEVTPLFFIGATLGNALAGWLGMPVDLVAALGFVAVFAGATNTPLACTVMGIELFGGEYAVYFAVACTTAYLYSGHTGIYQSQRLGAHKTGQELESPFATLQEHRRAEPRQTTDEPPLASPSDRKAQ